MANVQKNTAGAAGHLTAHYERQKREVKTDDGQTVMEYVKFGNQNIDVSRTHLNYNLAPEREGGQMAFLQQRLSEVRHLNRADVKVMCSWVVTFPEKYWYKDPNLHLAVTKDEMSKLFFERTYKFMAEKYGEENVISAYIHRDENRDHMHFAFIPVTKDKKRGDEKVSAKEVITQAKLKTFHTELERHLDSYGDWYFEVINEATKDGNKTIAELKKQTAHEEVLKAQREAEEARRRATELKRDIEPLQKRKKALQGEIEALQTEKEVLTAAEVEAIKGEKTLLGGLKGVTFKEFEALKRTAAEVNRMADQRDRALARAELSDKRATSAEARAAKAKETFEEAEQQRRSTIKAEREAAKEKAAAEAKSQYAAENAGLKVENTRLRREVSILEGKVSRLEKVVDYLTAVVKERLPELATLVASKVKSLRFPGGRDRD